MQKKVFLNNRYTNGFMFRSVLLIRNRDNQSFAYMTKDCRIPLHDDRKPEQYKSPLTASAKRK